MNLDNKEAFIDWMTKHSTDHSIITPLYDISDRATGVLASQWCKCQKQFLVQWAPTPCRVRHIPLHIEQGYKVHCTGPYTENQLDEACFCVDTMLMLWRGCGLLQCVEHVLVTIWQVWGHPHGKLQLVSQKTFV